MGAASSLRGGRGSKLRGALYVSALRARRKGGRKVRRAWRTGRRRKAGIDMHAGIYRSGKADESTDIQATESLGKRYEGKAPRISD